jgi:hypothetical protein
MKKWILIAIVIILIAVGIYFLVRLPKGTLPLRKGMQPNRAVKALQKAIKEKYGINVKTDGVYNDELAKAIAATLNKINPSVNPDTPINELGETDFVKIVGQGITIKKYFKE